jgi:hypothetical protein
MKPVDPLIPASFLSREAPSAIETGSKIFHEQEGPRLRQPSQIHAATTVAKRRSEIDLAVVAVGKR